MSLEPFRISHGWTYAPPDEMYVPRDPSRLWKAMRRFIASHPGGFIVHLGALELEFDLAPDLSTVFDKLPGVLEHLARGTPGGVELNFFEPGTALALELEREGESLKVRPRLGREPGARFDGLAEVEHRVAVRDFLCAWSGLMNAVLDAIASREPGLASDPELVEYRRRVTAVCA